MGQSRDMKQKLANQISEVILRQIIKIWTISFKFTILPISK